MQAEIDSLKNQLAEMKHLLFGRSNEKALSATTKSNAPPPSTRQRGQQKKTKGHGRRQHEHLPIVFEELDLASDEKYCKSCGLAFKPLSMTEDADVIEIKVDAYVRRIPVSYTHLTLPTIYSV